MEGEFYIIVGLQNTDKEFLVDTGIKCEDKGFLIDIEDLISLKEEE